MNFRLAPFFTLPTVFLENRKGLPY